MQNSCGNSPPGLAAMMDIGKEDWQLFKPCKHEIASTNPLLLNPPHNKN